MAAIRQTPYLTTAQNNDVVPVYAGMPVASEGAGGVVRASSLISLGRTNVAGFCVGGTPFTVINAALPGKQTKVQIGSIQLPPTQWAIATGDPIGLIPDTVYYLSATPGIMRSTPPTSLLEAVVPVGLAISNTLMLAYIGGASTVAPAPPPAETFLLANGEAVAIREGSPIAMLAGMAIFGSASSQLRAQIVGLCSIGAAPTLPVTVIPQGPFDLAADLWDLVTGDVGGLIPDATYYVALAAGNLTTTPPSITGDLICKVGRALSATTMLVTPRDSLLL